MVFLDGTAVNVALPVLARDLGAGFAGFQWVLNGYLVALAALVLPGGAAGDRWGQRRVFQIGAAGFLLASLACAAAPNLELLVAARVVQGVAGALLVPSSLSLVQVAFHPDDRGRAVGLWSGLSGVSTLLGPLVGGWLADDVTWRAVFVLNAPLAIAAVLLIRSSRPGRAERAAGRPLDPWGSVAGAVALGGSVFALTQGPEWGWTHGGVLASGATAVSAAVAFPLLERRQARPMLPPSLLRHRPFLGANLVTSGAYFALSGVFFLLAIQLQRVVGYSAFQAGAASAPITLLLLLLSPGAGRLAGRRGPEPWLAAGPLVAGVGAALLSRVGPDARYVADVLPGVGVFGLGLALTVAPVTGAALNSLEDARAGVAAGVNNAVARTAQLLAIPLLPLLAGVSGIEQVGGAAFDRGFREACWWAGAALAATAVASALALGIAPGSAGFRSDAEGGDP